VRQTVGACRVFVRRRSRDYSTRSRSASTFASSIRRPDFGPGKIADWRALCCATIDGEMHSGFSGVRSQMPMELVLDRPAKAARRNRSPTSRAFRGLAPPSARERRTVLFGTFTIADCDIRAGEDAVPHLRRRDRAGQPGYVRHDTGVAARQSVGRGRRSSRPRRVVFIAFARRGRMERRIREDRHRR